MVSPEELCCVCVVQARLGSSRLPGKILKPLNDKPALQWVLERCSMIKGVDRVICAVPDSISDDCVADLAPSLGVEVFRGSEHDVLARYWKAVESINTRYVMRVTSDCPFLDPEVCSSILSITKRRSLSYGATGALPNGLACEVFLKRVLEEAYAQATHPNDREHVTLWIKRHFKDKWYICPGDKERAHKHRWVLDYPEDYELLSRIAPLLEGQENPTSWKSVLKLVEKNPRLRMINASKIAEWQKQTAEIHKNAEK